MNVYDWIFIGMTIGFLVAGLLAWIIYGQAKREFLKKLSETDEADEELAPTVQDLYAYVNILQMRMLKKQGELYNERQNMSCEQLGSKDGERFVQEYEHFSAAVDMLGDVREYMRRAVEVKNE